MTILGYLMLPVAIGGLLFSEKWLLRLLIFWTLFSATSAINFGSQDTASALPMWMFIGSFWLLRRTIRLVGGLSIAIDRRILSSCLWLGGFLLVACVSLVMPAYINGRLIITSSVLGQQAETPLYLTSHNFSQLLYLMFSVLVAFGIGHLSLSSTQREEIEKVLLISAIVLALWGTFQFACNLTGIPYPYYIFNNSASPYAAGYQDTIVPGVTRISSAALEPSVFAQCLVSALPLTMPAWFGLKPVLSPLWDRFASLLFVVLLILSTSTTAILGIVAFVILLFAALKKAKMASFGRVVKLGSIALAAAMAAVIFVASSSVARQVATTILFSKSEGSSGVERALSVILAFGYFQQYPILGIGWGSVTSDDLFVFLLSSVGIIGAAAFIIAMLIVIARSWKNLSPKQGQVNSGYLIWFLSLAVYLVMSIFVGFPLVFGNFWVILGMTIASGQQIVRMDRVPTLTMNQV